MAPTLSNGLTSRQNQVMAFIVGFSQMNGFAPSIREIALTFQIAPSSVLDHLKALERKGFIKRQPSKSRCLEILRKDLCNS